MKTTTGFFLVLLFFNSVFSQSHQYVQQSIFGGDVRVIYHHENNIYAGTVGGGLFSSSDGGNQWIKSAFTFTYSVTVRSLLITPSGMLLAGCDGGLYYKMLNGGNTGSALQTLNVSSLARTSNGDLYAGTNAGIYKSADGINWSFSGISASTIRCLAVVDNNVYAGTSGQGIFRSTNNGSTWSSFGLATYAVRSISSHPNGNLFASTYGGVHKYNGTQWIAAGLETHDVPDLSIDNNGVIYAATWEGVYRSDNLGSTWNLLGFDQSITWSVKVISTNNVMIGRDGDGIYKSTDSGTTWTSSSHGLTAVRTWKLEWGNNLIFAGASGGAYRSTDKGLSWSKVLNYNHANRFWAFYINSDLEIYAGGSNGIYFSSDRGSTWIHSGLEGISVKAIKKNPVNNYLFAGTTTGVYRSTDNGTTWSAVNGGLTNTTVNDLEMLPNGILFASTGGGNGVYKTTNNGTTWLFANSGITSTYIYDLFRDASGKLYAVANSAVFRSTDNGANWLNYYTTVYPNEYFYSILVDSVGNKFVCGSQGYWYGTPDDSWLLGIVMLPNIQSVTEDDEGYVYLGTLGQGVFRSSESFVPVELTSFLATVDNGFTELKWTTASETNSRGFEIERRFDNREWIKIAFISGRGTTAEINNYTYTDSTNLTGTTFYRLKQIDYDGKFTYSDEIKIEAVPLSGYSLSQNYPNPFNPSTTIKYSLPQTGRITLRIYDLLGREVIKLIDEEKPAGEYETIWNASSFPSGVYLIKMQAGSFSETRKVVLMK
jgi:photosystem II stability/assembly factor-like uncharacterized protein